MVFGVAPIQAGAEESGTSVSGNETQTQTESSGSGSDAQTQAVSSVQQQIDSLPEVDELPTMKEDERNAAYMAVQEAYAAYDALTAEQQAQITGADCFEELFGWFNGQIAPSLVNISGDFGVVDKETGTITSAYVTRKGCIFVDKSTTTWRVSGDDFYVISNKEVTLPNLTIKGGRLRISILLAMQR